jgi:hypothetical protein
MAVWCVVCGVWCVGVVMGEGQSVALCRAP